VRRIHYFEDGGGADGGDNGGDNTSRAFNNNNGDNNGDNAPANNAPADNAPADNAPADNAPADTTDPSWSGLSDAPDGDPNVVPFRPVANSPLDSFTDIKRTPEQQAALDRQVNINDARDAYRTAYNTAQEAGPVSPLDQANILKQFAQTEQDKWTEPARKNSEAVEHNDLKFTVSPGDLTGMPLDRQVLKALGEVGLGGVYGVSGNTNQSAENVIAAQNFDTFIDKTVSILAPLVPGYAVAKFAADLASGKITPGQAIVSLVGDRVAALMGVNPAMFRAALSGQYGDGVASMANVAAVKYFAKETGMNPLTVSVLAKTSDLSSLTRNIASPLNVGPNVSGALSNTVDKGLASIGIGSGPRDSTASTPYFGGGTDADVNNILNSGNLTPTTESSPAPSSSAAPATRNISSTDTARGLNMPSLMSPSSGLAYVGDRGGSKYTPYSQNLTQLSLKPTEDLAMNYGPISNATAAQDIAKMSALPFESTMYASGGPVRHFDGGSLADSTSTETQIPTRTPQQQAAYEAMQQNLQYYKDLGQQKQNDQIMSGLKALAGVGALEATPERTPAREPLMRLGQAGTYTPPKVLPQLAALLQSRGMHLAEGGQPDDHQHPNYDGTPVFRTGGLNGLGGKYVEGKGDGTSDDITAMLANGEYVFSADVVSALGNGSNKAGAKELDQMVQAIRSRARSAPPDKLPPDAKSPLEYLKSKGKNHGTN
jgi:hypothetical protein